MVNLYSKRQKILRGEVPDVFVYDVIPQPLKVQLVHIIKDTFGRQHYVGQGDSPGEAYEFIFETLCREYGKFSLIDGSEDFSIQVLNFLLYKANTGEILDTVELAFKYIVRIIKTNYNNYNHNTIVKLSADAALIELNERFKEHGIGYSFDGNEIIRVDSTYIHSEITKPTIALLWSNKFKGANEEYLKAHEHYRHGRNKECLSECLKAFESTLKIICTEKGWAFNPTDTAKKLIQVCFQNGLVPSFTQNQFTSLQSLIESGVLPIRNRLGGHGQGQVPQKVNDEITRYELNLTGANIIFVIEQSGIK